MTTSSARSRSSRSRLPFIRRITTIFGHGFRRPARLARGGAAEEKPVSEQGRFYDRRMAARRRVRPTRRVRRHARSRCSLPSEIDRKSRAVRKASERSQVCYEAVSRAESMLISDVDSYQMWIQRRSSPTKQRQPAYQSSLAGGSGAAQASNQCSIWPVRELVVRSDCEHVDLSRQGYRVADKQKAGTGPISQAKIVVL
jgi:hypothetical protein